MCLCIRCSNRWRLDQTNFLLHDIDFADGALGGELTRSYLKKYSNTVKLLRYNCHTCYVSNINGLFKNQSASCDYFSNKTGNLERNLATCKKPIKRNFPMNLYQIRETVFDFFQASDIPYTDEKKVFQEHGYYLIVTLCECRMENLKIHKLQYGSENKTKILLRYQVIL